MQRPVAVLKEMTSTQQAVQGQNSKLNLIPSKKKAVCLHNYMIILLTVCCIFGYSANIDAITLTIL